MEEKNPYADIIELPHHQSVDRPHMSLYDRAAQFSPYAALVGYDDIVKETARRTDKRSELGESDRILMDQKLMMIMDMIEDGKYPIITVSYFIPDPLKDGGAYAEFTGIVKKVDTIQRHIIFFADNGRSSGKNIDIDVLHQIHSDLID